MRTQTRSRALAGLMISMLVMLMTVPAFADAGAATESTPRGFIGLLLLLLFVGLQARSRKSIKA